MLTINLLPKTRKEHYRYREINRMIILVCLLVMVVIVLLTLGFFSLKAMLNNQKTAAETALAQKKNQLDQLSTDQNKIKQLNQNMSEIKQLMQNQIDWNSILTEIASKTPTDMQLNKLSLGEASKEAKSATAATGSMQITLGGKAASRRSVMKFKDQLEQTDHYQNLTFSNLDETAGEGGNISVNFSLTGSFSPTTTTDKPTKTP